MGIVGWNLVCAGICHIGRVKINAKPQRAISVVALRPCARRLDRPEATVATFSAKADLAVEIGFKCF